MQAVPSIVGAGTAVAAASIGLVFGQPAETTNSRPPSHKRKLGPDYGSLRGSPAPTRPGTSSAAVESPLPSPLYPPLPLSSPVGPTLRKRGSTTSQLTPPNPANRRHSFIRSNEGIPPPISENVRDSVSSNGSWMRRLSIRPLSQHGSPRSSIGPDSPSLNISYGSGAAIFSTSVSSTPAQLPPNKLVKRATSTTAASNTPPSSKSGTLSRRGSRSHMPTLRRPATSHQRSATLQQINSPEPPLPSLPKYSLDQNTRPSPPPRPPLNIPEEEDAKEPRRWTSFFHSRIVRSFSAGESPARDRDASPSQGQLPKRSLHIRKGSMPRAYLINTPMMSITAPAAASPSVSTPAASAPVSARRAPEPTEPEARRRISESQAKPPASTSASASSSPDETPSKRARRSISMHFSSPTSWIARSGSMRRQKRGADSKSGGVRNVSAPVGATTPILAQGDVKQDLRQMFAAPDFDKREGSSSMGASVLSQARPRQRNSSSPLPPLSRLSSFNLDLYRLGSSTSPAAPRRPQQQEHLLASPILPSPSSFSIAPHSRDVSNERASTLAGSDLEMRAFMSGDDDDTDFKSDTMFDSLRTTGSTRVRNVDTPIESMFDESPPSTAGNSRTKRLSIQEILGRSWDGDTRIMEEDEGAPTPSHGANESRTNAQYGAIGVSGIAGKDSFDYENQAPNFTLAGRDFGRLSLDDDDDFDWAREEDNGVCNHLSPPSSSINSRRASPNLRTALANISGNGSPESSHRNDTASERPRSTLFDWSEPPSHERFDVDGPSPRPKTVHGKQEADVRSGRAPNRKGPAAAHVRSQSVPVVPELTESDKNTGKFRTWASGPKNVSEDWEGDFDFDEGIGNFGEGKSSTASMVVPASIQATQPTVKAHSGQIRELSLLVNGLKRLCRHARDLHIVDESPDLWKEAENIIELASPDEEEDGATTGVSDSGSAEFDPSTVEDRFLDEGFDGMSLARTEDPFDTIELDMSKTAVVRERPGTRRRSVFSPEDDIFGGHWPLADEGLKPVVTVVRPKTPERSRETDTPDSAMIASVMEAMQQQRRSTSAPVRAPSMKPSDSKLFFDTNSLQELVKRANSLFHTLSEMVRRSELITQSPACTPTRRERHLRRDGSPAFTRVFTDPATTVPSAGPQSAGASSQTTPPLPTTPMRLPKSHSSNSVLGRASIDSRTSNGIGQRMQIMTVN